MTPYTRQELYEAARELAQDLFAKGQVVPVEELLIKHPSSVRLMASIRRFKAASEGLTQALRAEPPVFN